MAQGNDFHLLIIDDDPVVRESVKNFLEKSCWQAHTAENGFQGIQTAITLQPDLILLDVIMPELDGLQTLVQLKKMRKTRQTPVVIITGRIDAETLIGAGKRGAVNFISKPFARQDLLKKIEFVLRDQASPRASSTPSHAVLSEQPEGYPERDRIAARELVDLFYFSALQKADAHLWDELEVLIHDLQHYLGEDCPVSVAARLNAVKRAVQLQEFQTTINLLEETYPHLLEHSSRN